MCYIIQYLFSATHVNHRDEASDYACRTPLGFLLEHRNAEGCIRCMARKCKAEDVCPTW